jgi:hypothetical protein
MRNKKINDITAIPIGEYPITLHTAGGFHERYKKKYPEHKGMLLLNNIPNFKWVLIHIGNTIDDTSGCLLVGNELRLGEKTNCRVVHSTVAYRAIYPHLAAAAASEEGLTIKVINGCPFDFGGIPAAA